MFDCGGGGGGAAARVSLSLKRSERLLALSFSLGRRRYFLICKRGCCNSRGKSRQRKTMPEPVPPSAGVDDGAEQNAEEDESKPTAQTQVLLIVGVD